MSRSCRPFMGPRRKQLATASSGIRFATECSCDESNAKYASGSAMLHARSSSEEIWTLDAVGVFGTVPGPCIDVTPVLDGLCSCEQALAITSAERAAMAAYGRARPHISFTLRR